MNSELDSNKFAAITSRHRIVWVRLNMASFKNFVFDGVVLIHGYWSSLLAQEKDVDSLLAQESGFASQER